jgi:hypothetical protein
VIHLDLSRMADRHLVIAYAIILVAQFGYAGWVAYNLRREKNKSR